MSARNTRAGKAARRAGRQAHGLAADAVASVAAFGTPSPAPLGPRAAAVIARYDAEATERCTHLRPRQPARWLAWHPRRLLCDACWLTAARQASRTRQDGLCDACGAYVPAPQDRQTPRMHAVHVTRGRDELYLGLCPACLAADQAATKGDPS